MGLALEQRLIELAGAAGVFDAGAEAQRAFTRLVLKNLDLVHVVEHLLVELAERRVTWTEFCERLKAKNAGVAVVGRAGATRPRP